MPRSPDGQELFDFLNTRHLPDRRLHRLEAEAYSAEDCVYFFTACARQHEDVFHRPELAAGVIEALQWRRRRHRWRLFAYCLMPDHLHFLVQLPGRVSKVLDGGDRGLVPEGVLDQIGSFKRFTTSQVWWAHGGRGPLWQKSSYDRIIRSGDSIEAAAWYTLENPVRKGLVQNWREYPYSGIIDRWWPEGETRCGLDPK